MGDPPVRAAGHVTVHRRRDVDGGRDLHPRAGEVDLRPVPLAPQLHGVGRRAGTWSAACGAGRFGTTFVCGTGPGVTWCGIGLCT